MKLFLIRHGQTQANLDGIYSGQSDVMLTDLGKAQAEALRPILEKIPFDRVYSSDLTRAIHTRQLALPGTDATTTPLLREYDLGSLTGLPIAEVRQQYGNLRSDFRPFGGEDPHMMDARTGAFLELLEADPRDYVAAFAHNGTIKSFLRLVLGEGCNTLNIVNANCNIGVLEFSGGRWKLLAWNLMEAIR